MIAGKRLAANFQDYVVFRTQKNRPQMRAVACITVSGGARPTPYLISRTVLLPLSITYRLRPSVVIAPARVPPLWEAAMAQELADNDPQWDMSSQPVPEFDQCIAW
jgi:hypothetical protein